MPDAAIGFLLPTLALGDMAVDVAREVAALASLGLGHGSERDGKPGDTATAARFEWRRCQQGTGTGSIARKRSAATGDVHRVLGGHPPGFRFAFARVGRVSGGRPIGRVVLPGRLPCPETFSGGTTSLVAGVVFEAGQILISGGVLDEVLASMGRWYLPAW